MILASASTFYIYLCLFRKVSIMKALVGAFNKEKALVVKSSRTSVCSTGGDHPQCSRRQSISRHNLPPRSSRPSSHTWRRGGGEADTIQCIIHVDCRSTHKQFLIRDPNTSHDITVHSGSTGILLTSLSINIYM